MPRILHLTCARTTYFELEVAADEGVSAEDLLTAALALNPQLSERDVIGGSQYRIVEIAAAEEGEGTGDPRAEAA
jgi:hypothetical protein